MDDQSDISAPDMKVDGGYKTHMKVFSRANPLSGTGLVPSCGLYEDLAGCMRVSLRY